MHLKRIFSLLILLFSLAVLKAEIRAVWATSWSIDTPAKLDELVADMIENKQNTILVEVRYRADALYTPNKQDRSYRNPDPKSYLLPDKEFDALAYILAKTEYTDIRVHAWLPMMVATPTDLSRLPDEHIYYTHPEWFTCRENGRAMNPISGEGLFLDPGNPEVKEYLRNVVRDITLNYPQLAGIHLDYLRYPGIEYGYHPISVTNWKKHSRTVEPLTWAQWKKNQITDLLTDIRSDLTSISSSLELSVAVVADYDRAIGQFSQEWHFWVEESLVDYIYPMAYSTNTNNVSDFLEDEFNNANKSRIVIGLRSFNSAGAKKYPVDKVEHNILEVQKADYAGVCLFSYGDLVKEYFPRLLVSCFSAPPRKIEPIIKESKVTTSADQIMVESDLPKLVNEPVKIAEQPIPEVPAPIVKVEKPIEITPEIIEEDEPEPIAENPLPAKEQELHPVAEIAPEPEEPTMRIIKGEDFKINFQKLGEKYKITVNSDVSCHIEWKISNGSSYPLYSKYRWYPRGETVEIWDGQLDNSEFITPGIYTLSAFSEVHRKSIILKIRLQ
jgi:uncharacterized lipoprotein YddW (UPF0748 family)